MDRRDREYRCLVAELSFFCSSVMGNFHAFLLQNLDCTHPSTSMDKIEENEFNLKVKLEAEYLGLRIRQSRFLDSWGTVAIVVVHNEEYLSLVFDRGTHGKFVFNERKIRTIKFSGLEQRLYWDNMDDNKHMINNLALLASHSGSKLKITSFDTSSNTFTIRGDTMNMLLAISLRGRLGSNGLNFVHGIHQNSNSSSSDIYFSINQLTMVAEKEIVLVPNLRSVPLVKFRNEGGGKAK